MNESQIIILDASAGTGKTYSLSKRFLRLLFESFVKNNFTTTNLQGILAITFTNKACFEMKSRILEILKKIALDGFKDIDEKKDIYEFLKDLQIENLKEISLRIIDELIKRYHNFQVYTIDSFIHTIIVSYAFQLGVSGNFEVDTNFDEYLSYTLDMLIDKVFTDENIYSSFKNFIKTYLLVEAKKSLNPKSYILKTIKSIYEQSMYYTGDLKLFNEDIDYFQEKSNLIKLMKEFLEDIPEDVLYKSVADFYKEYVVNNNLIGINIEAFPEELMGEGPIKKSSKFVLSKHKKLLLQKIQKKLDDLITSYSYQVFNSYIEIYKKTVEILDEIKKKKDIIFLEELNKSINKLLIAEETFVSELFMRLAVNIKHILIDEFQDTSLIQWENLVPIVSEVLANGGTLFYVGDKKQAIYRFRGSDASLFDSVPKYFSGFETQVSFLSFNRRSLKEIVLFNNKIFSTENLKNFMDIVIDSIKDNKDTLDIDTNKILEVYKHTSQSYYDSLKTEGYIYGELMSDTEEYDEVVKEKVLIIVKELIDAGIEPQDIAILVRKKDQAEFISGWLMENGFSVESEKTLNVIENPLIKEIISFLRFLAYPFDDVSFASFIFGDVFRHKSGISFKEIEDFIFNNRKNGYLYKSFVLQFPDLWNKLIKDIFDTKKFLSTYNLLIEVFNIFNIKEHPRYKYDYAFFLHFLKLARKAEEKQNSSLYYFLSYLNELKEEDLHLQVSTENAIKVLTIHKAKGLEFEVVILPYVILDIDVGKQKESFSRYLMSKENDYLRMVKLTKKLTIFSKKLSQLYYKEYTNLLIDEVNILYVAFTRARKQLYFFLPDKTNKHNYAKYLFPWKDNNIISFGKKQKYTSTKQEEKNRVVFQPVKTQKWTDFLIEERIKLEELLNRDKIREGKIIHRILSYLGNLFGKDVEKEIETAIIRSQSFYEISPLEIKTYKKLILELLEKDKIKNLFFIDKGTVLCEQEIVSKEGELKRIDRVIVRENKVEVVDYKLSFSLNLHEYKEQLFIYKSLLKEIYSLPVMSYILFLDTFELMDV